MWKFIVNCPLEIRNYIILSPLCKAIKGFIKYLYEERDVESSSLKISRCLVVNGHKKIKI